uniref:Uncharacterized protein n=1 Tax=Aegilops tauschii subsp. strangulata TaxID=200361 RepID=A0A453F5T5_AEGTS
MPHEIVFSSGSKTLVTACVHLPVLVYQSKLHNMPHRRHSSPLHVTPPTFNSGPTRYLKAPNVRSFPEPCPQALQPTSTPGPAARSQRPSLRST